MNQELYDLHHLNLNLENSKNWYQIKHYTLQSSSLQVEGSKRKFGACKLEIYFHLIEPAIDLDLFLKSSEVPKRILYA